MEILVAAGRAAARRSRYHRFMARTVLSANLNRLLLSAASAIAVSFLAL